MGVLSSEPDRTREQGPEAAAEPGGNEAPLLALGGLVTLGSEDAPACSDGNCL
ncbi:hypothetical protein GCM10007079_19180 [Nocardiopsis terrae]|uniref:Uncharacterized protein n=1 Tax=Nocardiopsis terrae TaxID=372655 RepID=A0ABR9HHK6_9ACTN|nr:hypothetical protein [Nocardiopsis terrae]GHC80316.1 hypothetical protein GCM10007079_19180 [Nocardiopsis terrae]